MQATPYWADVRIDDVESFVVDNLMPVVEGVDFSTAVCALMLGLYLAYHDGESTKADRRTFVKDCSEWMIARFADGAPN